MFNIDKIRQYSLTSIAIFGLLFVLLCDDSNSIINEISSKSTNVFSDPDKYLLPEAKLFIEFVSRLINLITSV